MLQPLNLKIVAALTMSAVVLCVPVVTDHPCRQGRSTFSELVEREAPHWDERLITAAATRAGRERLGVPGGARGDAATPHPPSNPHAQRNPQCS